MISSYEAIATGKWNLRRPLLFFAALFHHLYRFESVDSESVNKPENTEFTKKKKDRLQLMQSLEVSSGSAFDPVTADFNLWPR